MTKAEEMVLKTVHDLGAASDLDVQNYMGLSANKATRVLKSLTSKGYLKIAARRYQCDVNARDEDDVGITFVGNLWELTPEGRKAAKKIPDIDELMCIPISNLKKWRNEIRLIDADKMATDELAAFISAEPQPDGIHFRTVDDLGRICIPKDIRDKLGIKPGTECAVYATDELTSEEIIVIRRNENEKTP